MKGKWEGRQKGKMRGGEKKEKMRWVTKKGK